MRGKLYTRWLGRVCRSLCFFSDFKAAWLLLQPILPAATRCTVSRWQKPPSDVLKINCDASVRGNGFVGIGFVIRNNLGKVRGAGVDRIHGNLEVDCVKALAVRHALRFAKDFGVSKLIVESDKSKVIHCLSLWRVIEANLLIVYL